VSIYTATCGDDGCTITFTKCGVFREYVRPTIARMSKGASMVTGITDEKLCTAAPIEPVFGRMLEFIKQTCREPYDRYMLVYNGLGYDIPLIVAELERYTRAVDYVRNMRLTKIIDVLYWCRQHIDKTSLVRRSTGQASFKLSDVYKATMGKKLDGAHGALADCCAVVDMLQTPLFQKFVEMVLIPSCRSQSCATDDPLAELSNCCVNPMTFVRNCSKSCAQQQRGKRNRSRTVLDMLQSPVERKKTKK